MIKLKEIIKNNIGEYEFVGYHRQQHQRPSPRDDIFFVGGNGQNYYGKEYFREILDSLLEKDRRMAYNWGWIDFDWSNVYSEKYIIMENKVADWLNKKGYRWIFITENRPHSIEKYGDYIYEIYFRKKDILHIFDDPYGADDLAYAYVYHISNPPKVKEYQNTN